jgi:hypothetical protein
MLGSDDFAFMSRMLDVAAPAAEEEIRFYRYPRLQYPDGPHVTPGDRAAGEQDQITYENDQGVPVMAVVLPVNLESADGQGGRVANGDIILQIRHTAIPESPFFAGMGPEIIDQDRFVWNDAWYRPVRITSTRIVDVLGWIVRCERQ